MWLPFWSPRSLNRRLHKLQEQGPKFEASNGPAEVKYPSRAKAKMSKREKECVTILIGEHDSQTVKRRRILGDNEAWDCRATEVKVGDTGMWYLSSRLVGLFFWIRLRVICPSHMFYFGNWSPVTFWELMEFDFCWKYLVLSFSLLYLHHAYLRWKNACTHPHVSCSRIKLFQKKKNPTILLESIKILMTKLQENCP